MTDLTSNQDCVVLLHGLARTGRDFDEVAAALSDNFYVLCPDMIGRGMSSWSRNPEAEYAVEYYAGITTNVMDHFQIDQSNVVAGNPQDIIEQNARTGEFDDLVIRDSMGNLTKLIAPFINIGERTVAGLDVTLQYQWFNPRTGNFTLDVNATQLRDFKERTGLTSAMRNLAGTFADAAAEGYGALPKWKGNSSLAWKPNERLSLSYNLNYISSLTEQIPSSDRQRRIHSWVTHDLQLSYRHNYRRGLVLTFGADNLLDRAPPYATTAFNDGYDAHTYDAKGRFLYAKISQAL